MENTHRIIKAVCSAVVIALIFYFVVWLFYFLPAEYLRMAPEAYLLNNRKQGDAMANNLPANGERAVRMLFLGDMMLDRHVGEKISAGGLDYLFTRLVRDDFLANYHLISVNLEGAVTDGGEHYLPSMGYDFAFAPELVAGLKSYGFNFFNLANNHLADQGDRGIIETRENLAELGFYFSGDRDARVSQDSSQVVKLDSLEIGLAGLSMVYAPFDLAAAQSLIADLIPTTDMVIVNIHWGAEYDHDFSQIQQNIGHSLIDSGADIIIGHHPHVVQGIEIYRNKPIFYSLGNFVFDQYFSADTQEGLAVSVNINSQEQEYLLHPLISKASQPEIMDEPAKVDFLNRLAGWSPSDGDVSEAVISGKITLPQINAQ